MKYKVGDKVRVRKDLEVGSAYGGYYFREEEEEFKGKLTTIKKVKKDCYELDIDYGFWSWADEMLEPVAESIAESIAESDENTDKVSTNSDESKQFTKEDLKFGDIVTLRETGKWIYVDDILLNSMGSYIELSNYDKKMDRKDDFLRCGYVHNDIMKVQRYIHYSQYGDTIYTLTTLYERKEEILDEIEKEYLSAVIRPFRDRVIAITKLSTESKEWLYFNLNKESRIDDFPLPTFEKNTMYKGMEIKKEYTLKELGL